MIKYPTGKKTFINKKIRQFIYSQLREEPHYGNTIKKLIGYKPETWRYRVGRYRLFYAIDETEKIVYIFPRDFRKDAY
ncbi:MAG: type II toxin-antitoxin system RelE/ParE family toxin [Ignavibacteriaceae bacterium]